MAIINKIANVVHLFSLIGVVLLGLLYGYEELVGEDAAEKLLAQMNIPLSVQQISIIGIVLITLFILTQPGLRNNYRYWKKLRKTFRSAKEMYFDNFGDYLKMKKNGEYDKYKRQKPTPEQERQWGEELKALLLSDIIDELMYHKMLQLSRIQLPPSEIIDAFREIALQCPKEEAKEALQQLKCSISSEIYQEVFPFFEQAADENTEVE